MIYNNKSKKIKTNIDCLNCEYFNNTTHQCEGIGIRCFEYDEKTKTCIDPVTKLPIKLD